jgi:hypothetical protein
MSMRAAAVLAIALASASCVSTSVVRLGTPEPYPPVKPDEVRVFLSEEDVGVAFVKVAVIDAQGDHSWANDERMVNAMRKRAAKLGANGIIIGEFKDPSTAEKIASAVIGVGGERKGRVLAIRMMPPEDMDAEPN